MSITCDLCQGTYASADRMGGMNVCDRCVGGWAVEEADQRGWSISEEQWTTKHNDQVTFHGMVSGQLPVGLPIETTIRVKQGLWAFVGLFSGVKTGDPLFDKLAWVKPDKRGLMKRFLADEAAQSAVMDLVGEGARIKISERYVEAHASGPESIKMNRLGVETIILMTHLTRFVEGGGY